MYTLNLRSERNHLNLSSMPIAEICQDLSRFVSVHLVEICQHASCQDLSATCHEHTLTRRSMGHCCGSRQRSWRCWPRSIKYSNKAFDYLNKTRKHIPLNWLDKKIIKNELQFRGSLAHEEIHKGIREIYHLRKHGGQTLVNGKLWAIYHLGKHR